VNWSNPITGLSPVASLCALQVFHHSTCCIFAHASYILHNLERYALRNLNVGIDNAVIKFYGYFSISANMLDSQRF